MTTDERAAIEAAVEGGIVGFVQRTREAHGPTFTHTEHVSDRYPNGVVYSGCRCDTLLCGHRDLLLIHIDDLRNAYSSKVQDLARETTRAAELHAALAPLIAAHEAANTELPFDCWTAGLVALWEAVHDREPRLTDGPDYHADHAAWVLRQIGGTP